jgi:ribosomal protein S18 acetylase RimI-like enzyme
MTTNAAVSVRAHDEPELAFIAEHIERRAWCDLVGAAPQWVLRTTGLAIEEIGGAMMLAAPGLNHLLFNRVIGLGEQAAATPELIAEIMGRYWDASIERYWVHVGPYARPARLGRMLQEQGLAPYRRSWVKLVRPAQRASAPVSEFLIRKARLDDAIAVASIVGNGFDLPQHGAEMFGALIDRRRWNVYVAQAGAEIVAAAGMFIEGEAAYFAFAATRPEFRNRGAQRALLPPASMQRPTPTRTGLRPRQVSRSLRTKRILPTAISCRAASARSPFGTITRCRGRAGSRRPG